SAGEACAGLVETVLDFVPQRRAAKALLDMLVEQGPLAKSVEAQACGDVRVDAEGWKRIGSLKDHADAAPEIDRIDGCGVDVFTIDTDAAVDPGADRFLVQTIDASHESRFAAS